MMEDQRKPEAKVLLDAGATMATMAAEALKKMPIAVLPEGAKLESLEPYYSAPIRKAGEPVFILERDFNAYAGIHKDESSAIYADRDNCTMTAVFDGDRKGDDGAAWRCHRAKLDPGFSDDWKAWQESNDKAMRQVDFAQFVEDQRPLIVDPTGAELLEMTSSLQAKKTVTFKSSTRLQDGAREFTYDEDIRGKVGSGSIEVPDEFKLRLQVFRNGSFYELTAKLRYRIDEGKLFLWYHLHRPQDVVDAAFAKLVDAVEVDTQIKVWFGVPAKSRVSGR